MTEFLPKSRTHIMNFLLYMVHSSRQENVHLKRKDVHLINSSQYHFKKMRWIIIIIFERNNCGYYFWSGVISHSYSQGFILLCFKCRSLLFFVLQSGSWGRREFSLFTLLLRIYLKHSVCFGDKTHIKILLSLQHRDRSSFYDRFRYPLLEGVTKRITKP